MSNFETYTPLTGGFQGTNPAWFSASTEDSLATVITAGYIADKVATGETKVRDIWIITYSDGGGSVGTALFIVTATSNGSFINFGEPYDAALASIAGLTTSADKMIYTTASDTYAVADLTSFARTILDDANAGAVRTTIGAQAQSNILAGQVANGGGSATITLTGLTGVVATSSAAVSVQASTNAVSVQKVTCGSNQITVLLSGDPGASTILNYIVFLASQ